MSGLTITNKKIVNFYNKHTNLSIENHLLQIINILEPIIENDSINTDTLNDKMDDLINTFMVTHENNNNQQQNYNNELIKNIIEILNNRNDNIELNFNKKLDVIYQNMLDNIREIKNTIPIKNEFIDTIRNEFKIQKQIDEKSKFDDYIVNQINNLYSNIVENINNTELRLTRDIKDVINVSETIINTSNNTYNKIEEHLQIYSKSSKKKGNSGENRLYNILLNEYPNYDITNSSGLTGTGDFIINTDNNISILIETKEYQTNVSKKEVDKFYRDVKKNKTHGIFISHSSGIVGKLDMQIDLFDNYILIFISNADYNIFKIKTAINTILFLSQHFNNKNDNNIIIDKQLLNLINNDFTKFESIRKNLINGLKEYYNYTIKQYNDMHLDNINLFLSKYFSDKKENICKYCNIYTHSNRRSLSRHETTCKKKYTNTNTDTDTSNDI